MHIKLTSIQVFLPAQSEPLFKIGQFEIPQGTRLLIQGPSGRGKTTFLHLVAGLFQPTDGYVFLDEQNLRFLSDEARCQVRRDNFGIVFQKLNLIDHLTARENVWLSQPPKRRDHEAAEKALAQVGLGHKRDTRTAVLSLGEQQRVAVARVIAAKPKVILADEPTSSLDEANAEAVISGLLGAGRDNPTLIVVSHDQRLRRHFPNTISFEELISR